MSQPNNRRREPGTQSGQIMLLGGAAGVVVAGGAAINVAVHVGNRIDGRGATTPGDPFTVAFGVLGGQVAWPDSGTPILMGLGVGALLIGGLVVWALARRGSRRTRVDRAAPVMGRGRDIEAQSRRHVQTTATRLGVSGPAGVPIGTTLGGQALLGSWEDTHVDVWGTRTGKTTARAVPAILDAPGAVLVTSNKRDVVDATRDVRAASGPVWVFDPQSIAGEDPTWWWNPLSYVTDEVKASKLAEHFASGSRDTGARTDAFFDGAGQDLLAGLLLAAALDSRPITDVFTWITRPTDTTSVDVLREHGFTLTADQVAGVVDSPEKQRAGVFGTAQQMASCLTVRQVAAWVTPTGGNQFYDRRPQLDPAEFVAAGGTLYSLSKEGRGTAGPLVTALTVAVIEAAEDLAARSAGGRLSVPLVCVLDEAANVCRWRQLPDLYSHYGSRGIVLMTILQSWSQGVDVWGESGMRKLWSASNIKVYGGGVSEVAFLEDLSRLIGDYDRVTASLSTGKSGRGVSRQLHRERIFDVAELAAMPKGRAVVLASGSRPTLIRTRPWMSGPHAEQVRASILAHDPEAQRTLRETEKQMAAVAAGDTTGETV